MSMTNDNGIKVAKQKSISQLQGTKRAIVCRGAIALSSIVLLIASVIALVILILNMNIIAALGWAYIILAIVGIVVAIILIPATIILTKWEISYIKGHLKNRETIMKYIEKLGVEKGE